MREHLSRVAYPLFLFEDEVVEALLRTVFETAVEGECGRVSSVITCEAGGLQYFVAWYGTLYLNGESCSRCDSVCQHNPRVGETLAIRDLARDPRTAGSSLVTGPPSLLSYQGIRITPELSLIILYAGSALRREPSLPFLRSFGPVVETVLASQQFLFDDEGRVKLAIDEDERIVRATAAARDFFGRPEAELVGLRPSDLVAPDESWSPDEGHVTLRLGDDRRVELTTTKLRRVTIVAVRDVTKSFELERVKAEREAQHKLLGQLAHELRNKFTASAAVLEQLADQARDDPLRVDVESARALLAEADEVIATRLSVADMLAADRPRRQLRVDDLLARLVARARARAHPDVSVSSTTRAAGAALELDLAVVDHAFQTVVDNACKFARSGRIEVALADVADDAATFACVDTGPGIPESAQPHLFDTRVLSGDVRGAGLSLASSALCLGAVGGRIWIHRSGPGYTEIRFSVPCASVALTSPASTVDLPPRDDARNEDHVTRRIDAVYIIEDSPLMAKLMSRKLAAVLRPDVRVHEFETAEAALAAMRPALPGPRSLVSVDENLQSKGGLIPGSEVVAFLADNAYKGIIVSASGDAEASKRHAKLGAHAVLGKPFPSNNSLADLLRDADHRRRASPHH